MKREWFILASWILVFILIRSLHFTSGLNFSVDQATDSLRGFEILREHKLTLIGTHTGFSYHGRLLFLGPLFIYTYMAYNLLGGFDPVLSSYIFMLTGALGIIPLYFGMKRLANASVGLLSIAFYTLVPYFIDYTKFMWNPNFQFILTPVFIYFFSRYVQKKSYRWLFATSALAGALLHYHYQFILIMTALGIFLLAQKSRLRNISIFVAGTAVGFLPVIIFEFRHNFYNLRTLVLYLQHFKEVLSYDGPSSIPNHFFLSTSLVAICIALTLLKKYVNKSTVIMAAAFLLPFSTQYLKTPDRMFNSDIQWRIQDELKVYSVIKKFDLKETAVSHLDYDNAATVQRYFLTRDQKPYLNDYYKNKYLFAVSKTGKLDTFMAYEISTFAPRTVVQSWPINPIYTLYLLERSTR